MPQLERNQGQPGSRKWRVPNEVIAAFVGAGATLLAAFLGSVTNAVSITVGAPAPEGTVTVTATPTALPSTSPSPTSPDGDSFREVSGPGETNYEFLLPHGTGADLDNQVIVQSPAVGVDIVNGLVAPNTFDVYGTSGGQKMYRVVGPAKRQTCEDATSTDSYVVSVFLEEIRNGDQFCLRTDGKRLARFVVTNISRGAGDDVDISFSVSLWS
jgi:hypothetical protein